MSRWARRLVPSPAMIVALVALFMAMGGSAYALVITGKSIRNGSITGKDVKNRTLTGSKGKPDSWGGGSIKESTPEHGAERGPRVRERRAMRWSTPAAKPSAAAARRRPPVPARAATR